MQVWVNIESGGDPVAVPLDGDEDVAALKARVARELQLNETITFQLTLEGGEALADDALLEETWISDGDTLTITNMVDHAWRRQLYERGAWARTATVDTFPDPTNLNVTMMPFVLGTTFDESMLPPRFRSYYELVIKKIVPLARDDVGRVCYLTITERDVGAGETFFLPGIHTDSLGVIAHLGDGLAHMGQGDNKHLVVPGGSEPARGFVQGGVWEAANVPAKKLYRCQVVPDKRGREIIGPLGVCDHLRAVLNGTRAPAPIAERGLYWRTDRTPWETLTAATATPFQRLQVTTRAVALWLADEATANPLGVAPDAEYTKVVAGERSCVGGWRVAA